MNKIFYAYFFLRVPVRTRIGMLCKVVHTYMTIIINQVMKRFIFE